MWQISVVGQSSGLDHGGTKGRSTTVYRVSQSIPVSDYPSNRCMERPKDRHFTRVSNMDGDFQQRSWSASEPCLGCLSLVTHFWPTVGNHDPRTENHRPVSKLDKIVKSWVYRGTVLLCPYIYKTLQNNFTWIQLLSTRRKVSIVRHFVETYSNRTGRRLTEKEGCNRRYRPPPLHRSPVWWDECNSSVKYQL